MLSVVYAESCMQVFNAECHYAECHYAECQNAECHVTIKESGKYFVNYGNTQSLSTVLQWNQGFLCKVRPKFYMLLVPQ